MAENMYRGLWSLLICVGVTFLVSMATKPKPEEELKNLVYGLTPLPKEGEYPLLKRPIFWAGVCAALLVAVNIIFW
jgi:SSS family solute:Na+ symporter